MRTPTIVAVGRHYGLTIATCVPADPESKGGSEATVRIARADLVPTDHNLRDEYEDFAALERACVVFCERVNTREHRITRRARAVMLAEEQERLHRLPAIAHTVCFGETRKVSTLVDERVWARANGGEIVVVHADSEAGPREVARHAPTTPGRPSIDDAHYPQAGGRARAQAPRGERRRAGVPCHRAGW